MRQSTHATHVTSQAVPSDATLYQLATDEPADRLVAFYERYQIEQHDHLRAAGDDGE